MDLCAAGELGVAEKDTIKGREGEKGTKNPKREIRTVSLDRNTSLKEAGKDREVREIQIRQRIRLLHGRVGLTSGAERTKRKREKRQVGEDRAESGKHCNSPELCAS